MKILSKVYRTIQKEKIMIEVFQKTFETRKMKHGALEEQFIYSLKRWKYVLEQRLYAKDDEELAAKYHESLGIVYGLALAIGLTNNEMQEIEYLVKDRCGDEYIKYIKTKKEEF